MRGKSETFTSGSGILKTTNISFQFTYSWEKQTKKKKKNNTAILNMIV